MKSKVNYTMLFKSLIYVPKIFLIFFLISCNADNKKNGLATIVITGNVHSQLDPVAEKITLQAVCLVNQLT